MNFLRKEVTSRMDSSRILIVLGMARSGTTILTYVLANHPQIHLITNGKQYHVLENNVLPGPMTPHQLQFLDTKIKQYKGQYLLLKRPWEEGALAKYQKYFPNARFLCTLRDFESIKKSWMRTRMVQQDTREHPKEKYSQYYECATRFAETYGTQQFRFVPYDKLVSNPSEVFKNIASFLHIAPTFDTSTIGFGKHWDNSQASKFKMESL